MPRLLALRWMLLMLSALIPAHAQRLKVLERESAYLYPQQATIEVELTARMAVTRYDLVFAAPPAESASATFELPLAAGQRVTAFSVDVNGAMRDAVSIKAEPARVLFVDKARAANLKIEAPAADSTAIFSIPVPPATARQPRTIRVTVHEELASGREASIYRLNLDLRQTLQQFRLLLNAHTASSLAPHVATTLDLSLPPWRDGQYMEIERLDFDARGAVEITIPKPEYPRVMTGRHGGKEYFYAEIPAVPLLFSRPAPRTIALLWDSSASGRNRDHAKELALLNAWFAELSQVEVRLYRIRDRVYRDDSFTVKSGDWSYLRKALEATVYEGATSLEGLVDDAKVDTWIVFSDGVFNFGTRSESSRVAVKGAVHTVNSSPGANMLWLQTTAARGGGEFVDLTKRSPSEAAFSLQTQSMRILAVDYDTKALENVFPLPGAVVTGDWVVASGELRATHTTLRLLVGHDRENAMSIEVPILAGNDLTPYAVWAWASDKVFSLITEHAPNAGEVRRLSHEFKVPLPNTKLVVLNTAAEYARAALPPPDALRAEWDAHQQSIGVSRAEQEAHREAVVSAFQARIAWWEKTFPTSKPRRHDPSADSAGGNAPTSEALNVQPILPRRPNAPAVVSGRVGFAGSVDSGSNQSTLAVRRWTPGDPHVAALRQAKPDRRLAVYLEHCREHNMDPGFFLESADVFLDARDPETAVRVLSNVVEMQIDDPVLLRVLGHRFMQADRPDLAAAAFERVLEVRADEPQSRRDLALALAASGQPQRAVDLLWEIVSRPWDSRFPSIELIALSELNAILATSQQRIETGHIDQRLLRSLPLELRIVLTWDATDCDMDLWVDDPNGETARYDFPLTHQGGLASNDFAGGLGPEEFLLKKAKPGKYVARINYFGDRRQTAYGPVTAQVRVITGFGTPQQQETRTVLRLPEKQEIIQAATIDLGPASLKKSR